MPLVLAFAPGAGVCAFSIADTQDHAYAPGDDWGVCRARREVRGRAAVLDRAGELDRRLQGMRHLARRLWVLKLRARG